MSDVILYAENFLTVLGSVTLLGVLCGIAIKAGFDIRIRYRRWRRKRSEQWR